MEPGKAKKSYFFIDFHEESGDKHHSSVLYTRLTMMRIRFWGVRGSIPVPGPSTVHTGGNTSCVEVRCGKDLIILDAGTGIRLLGNELLKEEAVEEHIFISHVHWDHIQGFPFFGPAFAKGNRIFLYGGRNVTTTLEETLYGQMNYPNFPVMLDNLPSQINFNDLDEGEIIHIGGESVVVDNVKLNHPNGVYSYKITYEGRSVVYATDTEHYANPDTKLLEFARGADLLIYDAQYFPKEYTGESGGGSKVGWGHSTNIEGARLAGLAGVKKLVLFHHDPQHTDEMVDEKERAAREVFDDTVAAREGMVIELG
jgi:phosphoribosyl 1,2-cyclic phosphodiesterase